MNRLRTRLLFSYVLVIAATLAVIGITLLVVLGVRPQSVSNVYQRLTDTVRGLAARFDTQGDQPASLSLVQIEQTLIQLAEATETRILVIETSGEETHAAFDSLGKLAPGALVSDYRIDPQRGLGAPLHGAFEDPDGEAWLFVSVPRILERLPFFQARNPRQILFAAPRPGLAEAFAWFRENLLVPILQAGLVGLIVAAALSFFIARSVARPLQSVARAAEAVAGGDFDQHTPEAGPDEVQTVARAFNDMARRVKDSQHAQRDFVANVSHDLRTPLTSIQGFSQAILDGTAAPPDGAKRAASVIYDEAARLSRMVDELLDLARIESGEWRMERQAVNPAAILRAVAERQALRAQTHSVALNVKVPDLPNIVGDGDRLAQVFTNLVDNALKHTPAGGAVTLDGGLVNGGVELVVADNGEGIPPEHLARIFERFYQVDKSRQRTTRRSGAGLGLAISREIVQAHGGNIRAESVVGLGARFVVWLPLPQPTDTTVARRKRSHA